MMFATVEAVAQADAIWAPGRHNSDVAAQTAAGESFYVHLLDGQRRETASRFFPKSELRAMKQVQRGSNRAHQRERG